MSADAESIALVGLAARLPGADDAREYWRNLRAGRESVSVVPDDDLLAAGVTPDELADPYYVRNAALVPHMREFDADFFDMTGREARFSDPQLKLMLEVSHAALEDAGFDPVTMSREVGMFGACGLTRYSDFYIHGRLQQHDSSNVVLNNPDYMVTYTAYKLDLRGPSLTVLTACSSSLVAVHLACQSLLLGECDVALAGGANIELPYGHGYRWNPGGVRSRDGHCRPFDIAANGTIFSNGAGVVVLKRLSDALADGDHIRAVVRGSALHNDGSHKMSYTAPSVDGQRAAVVQAMRVAGVGPTDMSYVEAHGTATAVGDPIELSALHKAYRSLAGVDLPPASIDIGSVKGNIGHTVPTAGVAGLIKVALALEAEELPASINFTAPNPRLEIDRTPFRVNSELRPWPRDPARVRLAGVSSFGVGGTNAHLVVSEGPAPVRTPDRGRARIVVWSARTGTAADATRDRLAEHLAGSADDLFADTVATLQRGRTPHRFRRAVVARGRAEAERLLREGRPLAGDATVDRRTVFVFPGQGSQHTRMAAGLYGVHEVFTATVDRCLDAIPDGADLKRRWLDGDDAALRPTVHAQPLLFAVGYALAKTLTAWGVRPDALIGHSVGELVAAAVADVFTPEDGMRLAAARGRLMQEQEPGSMLAVRADVATVRPLLPEGYEVAVVNGADQVVVAAPADPAPGRRILEAAGLGVTPLVTSHAFHSPAMRPAVEPFARTFDGVRAGPPAVDVYSSATGRLATAKELTDPGFWARQLVEPVRFDLAVDAVVASGPCLLVEVGPNRALTGVLVKHPAVREAGSVVVPVLPRGDRRERDDERALFDAVGTAWVHGGRPDWAAVRPDEPLRRVPVPGYPYERKRMWIDPKTGPAAPYVAPAASPEPVTAQETERETGRDDSTPARPAVEDGSPFSTVAWTELPADRQRLQQADGQVALALVPADRDRALPLLLALQRRGYRVVRMRPADSYTAGDHDYGVRPGEESDLTTAFADLTARGLAPRLIAHGWALDEWDPVSTTVVGSQLDTGFHALHTMAKAAVRATPVSQAPPDLLVVTEGAVDVSGGEAVHPVKAMLPAQVRTLAAELSGMGCRLVDVVRVDEEDLADELATVSAEPVVALRAGRRWVPGERAFVAAAAGPALRPRGVYLVTGGLGGLGLAVAQGLAGTGLCPRLVLLGRSGITDSDGVAATAVAELEALGAQVRVHACDVTDARAIARVLDITAAQFGPVDGVLHLAGVPGDGMLLRRERADADRVIAPKVRGMLTLVEAFRGRATLDFLVAFSSRSALAGMVGNGDYAAGNAFLDAFAGLGRTGSGRARRMLSVGWPAWHSVGMLGDLLTARPGAPDRRSVDTGTVREQVTVMTPARQWELDEHRVDGRPVLPATGHLDAVLRAFTALFGRRPDDPVGLEDVVFAQPLAVPRPTEVRIRFVADGDRYRFTIASRPEGSDAPWRDHTGGYLRTLPADAGGRTVDVAAAVAELEAREIPPIAMMTNRMFHLGPRWNSITGVWANGSTKLVRQAIPEAFRTDLDTHLLHPALLDMATSIMRDPERDGLRLPFMYRRFAVFGPLPGELFSRIRRQESDETSIVGDIELFAPDGRLVGEIEGFTMRRAERQAFGQSASANGRRAEPARPADPADGAGSPPGGSGGGHGVAPDQGARLLLTLLSTRSPGHVVVRPYEDGAPVPLPTRDHGAASVSAPGVVLAAALAARSGAATTARPDPAPAAPAPAAGGDGAAGAPVDDRLRGLWTEVLGTDDITTRSDFFDLGGDSMSAVQLMGRIRDEFGVEIGIAAIFDNPSIGALAGLLRAQGAR